MTLPRSRIILLVEDEPTPMFVHRSTLISVWKLVWIPLLLDLYTRTITRAFIRTRLIFMNLDITIRNQHCSGLTGV